MRTSQPETNWAGSYEYQSTRLHRPSTVEQLQEIVAGAPSVHVLGSRHSFNGIADSAELITLRELPSDVTVDHAQGRVGFGAGLTYGELAVALRAEGVALHNLASLPHISVAGAVMTATHGSGDTNGNLATAVAGLEMVTSTGEVVTTSRGDADFDGLVVGLGAVGAVTRLVLDVEPAYEVRTRAFEGLGWKALFDHFDEISASGYSVSVFTRWSDNVDQVWVKSRVTDAPEVARGDLFGAVASTVERHPVLGLDPTNCSPQLGRPGLWSERLPHFRMEFTPSTGEELQSEYVVARRHTLAAIESLRALGDRMRPVLQVCEMRTVAADRLWMSMQYGQDTTGFHFTWMPDQDMVEQVLLDLETALAPFEARPHWGKVFLADAAAIAPLYERRPDFIRLLERLDPRGAFRNPWLKKHVLGE
ncbi:MAG TPA: D-arabinono-1,4-lactone oxidase [Streptosporangiaceae bacterium]